MWRGGTKTRVALTPGQVANLLNGQRADGQRGDGQRGDGQRAAGQRSGGRGGDEREAFC